MKLYYSQVEFQLNYLNNEYQNNRDELVELMNDKNQERFYPDITYDSITATIPQTAGIHLLIRRNFRYFFKSRKPEETVN